MFNLMDDGEYTLLLYNMCIEYKKIICQKLE